MLLWNTSETTINFDGKRKSRFAYGTEDLIPPCYRVSVYWVTDLAMSRKLTMTCAFASCFKYTSRTDDAKRLYEIWVYLAMLLN